MTYFPFAERRDTFAFTCTHILDGEGEIRLVTHHFDDGSYEFLCGEEGHAAAHAVIITIGELLDLDPSIALVSDLPVGCCAMRKGQAKSLGIFQTGGRGVVSCQPGTHALIPMV